MSNVAPLPSEQDLAVQRAAIDRSLRLPVLFFFTSAMFWLMLALFVGFVSSIQAFQPDFLAITSRFGYGYLVRFHEIALLYGWGFNAVFGVSLWLTARMSRTGLLRPLVSVVAGHIWNIAVTVGMLAVLFGGGSGIPFWEMPVELWPVLFVTALVIGTQIFGLFYRRDSSQPVYVAQWFVLGAWCWLAFAMPSTFLLIDSGGSGVFATLISAWWGDGLLYLWFVAVAIGLILYLVPKVSGRALPNERLLLAGFWGLFGLGVWSGMQRYLGSVAPVKLPALGGGAAILAVVPLVLIATVVIRAMIPRWSHVSSSPTLRFSVSAVIALVLFAVTKALLGLYGVASLLEFSMAVQGVNSTAIFGVFSLAMFGAMYFITPRTSGCDWRSAYLADRHFWFNVYGVIFILMVTLVGGYGQGWAAAQYNTSWDNAVNFTMPYLIARAVSFLFLFISNVVFFTQIAQMWLGRGRHDGAPLQLQRAGH